MASTSSNTFINSKKKRPPAGCYRTKTYEWDAYYVMRFFDGEYWYSAVDGSKLHYTDFWYSK